MPADIPKNLSAITELQNYRITELQNYRITELQNYQTGCI
ncbi:hypothetical protein LA635_p1040 (plasmid) [Erwinia amylovora LA635]|nr:hypothetical protein LA635_p1040 [Erwinia amylovora LA635]CDK23867.1 hypothetical protein LA637_p1040 [Erwinia amylovora LA637]